jgi:hypothetical protein
MRAGREVYPFGWQSKLHGAGMYLQSRFAMGDFYVNLGAHELPEHFLGITKDMIKAVAAHFFTLPERSLRIADVITGYQFGYRA